jgi:hypothetical protein
MLQGDIFFNTNVRGEKRVIFNHVHHNLRSSANGTFFNDYVKNALGKKCRKVRSGRHFSCRIQNEIDTLEREKRDKIVLNMIIK